MNKRGFTLIELLAVIVILAIIALIATPIVLDIISDSRDSSNKQSIESLVRAAELYHASNVMNETFPKVISLPDKNNVLKLENAENMEGYITISKRGEIEVNAKLNGTTYAKNYNNSKIYNLKKEEYKYEGNPDEWIVSINDPSKILNYNPKINSKGTKEIVEAYVSIPHYFYTETSESFLNDLKIEKKETLEKTMNELNIKYPGHEYFIPDILKEEINLLITKLKQKFGNEITDETLIDVFDFEDYIFELEKELPIIYDYYLSGSKLDLTLSGKVPDLTTIMPSKVNGVEIKKMSMWERPIDCETAKSCKELYGVRNWSNYYFNLIIPEGIEVISGSFFDDSQIYTLKLPSTLKEIGAGEFSQNQLTEIEIPDSIEVIARGAFSYNKIKKIKFPANLTTIEYSAFINNQLTKVVIPDGVTTIGMYAFRDNPIKEVVIPASVETIEYLAFGNVIYGSSIIKVTIEGDKTRFNDVWEDIGFPAELKPVE